MTIILIDARHYGAALRRARRTMRMNLTNTAHMLNITTHELHQYETGRQPIPHDLMYVLIQRGLALSMCRTFNSTNIKNKNPR